MNFVFKKVWLSLLFFACGHVAIAQESWLSPEVEQMYSHAEDYMTLRNFQDAIVTYKQAILLAPEKIILYEGLGSAFYYSGKYSEAEQTLLPLFTKPGIDAQCFDLLAASQVGQKKIKEARATVYRGLERFPGSGPLYYRLGLIYDLEKNKEGAVKAWLNGIKVEVSYSLNYHNAALVYLSTENITRGILYAESYLAMQHDTAGDQVFKKQLWDGYKAMFEHIAGKGVPKYGHSETIVQPDSFIGAVQQVYSRLTPVISDGISVENLTMVRTRFLIDWFTLWNNKYPFALFSYQDKLVKGGHFDRYNEWLFGKVENSLEYDSWNKFHDGDMDLFIAWRAGHLLMPLADNFYEGSK